MLNTDTDTDTDTTTTTTGADTTGPAKPRKKFKGSRAAIRLKIARVERLDPVQGWVEAQPQLYTAYQATCRSVLLTLTEVRARLCQWFEEGRTRFPARGEPKPWPDDCITREDTAALHTLINHAMSRHGRAAGLTSMVYNAVGYDLYQKEFSNGKDKEKLADIVRFERGFPQPTRVGMIVNANSWVMETIERTTRKGKTYTAPVLYLASLTKGEGGGSIRLICHAPRRRGSEGIWGVIDKMTLFDRIQDDAADDADTKPNGKSKSAAEKARAAQRKAVRGWKRGTLTIKRIKRPQDARAAWYGIVAYGSPRVTAPDPDQKSIMYVHRGIANLLTIAIVTPDGVKYSAMPGDEIVNYKAQMRARQARYRQSRRRRLTMDELGTKEANYTSTKQWGVVADVRKLIEANDVACVVTENLGTFRCDVEDDRGRALPSYIRSWPFAALKQKLLDSIPRRLGVPITMVSASHISQQCPECGHTAPGNVTRLPRTNPSSEYLRDGTFSCELCSYKNSLDTVAIQNMVLRHGNAKDGPAWAATAVREGIAKLRALHKRHENITDEDESDESD